MSVLHGTHILYSNPVIFRLEHLSLVENTVKRIHFQDNMQEINALQQSCVIYLYFFFLADLNSLGTTFAERTCYLFFNAQKMKFFIKDFFSKCDQIHRKLRIWSHLLKKSSVENFIFCAIFAY